MSFVSGTVTLNVSVPVKEKNESLALLIANYLLHPELLIGLELFAIDCHGKRTKIHVNGCVDSKLEVFED